MKSFVKWNEGMNFAGECDGHVVTMDAKAPLGKNQGMTPKEFVATGLGGCTAMDVVALLKKHKQEFTGLRVEVDVTPTSGAHPVIFKEIHLNYMVTGTVDAEILRESVRLSQTRYCGVSAMLAKAVPIHYVITLNNEKIGEGQADFGGHS